MIARIRRFLSAGFGWLRTFGRGAAASVDEIVQLNERAQAIAVVAERLLPAERAQQLRGAAAAANVAVGRLITARKAAERGAAIATAQVELERLVGLTDPLLP